MDLCCINRVTLGALLLIPHRRELVEFLYAAGLEFELLSKI